MSITRHLFAVCIGLSFLSLIVVGLETRTTAASKMSQQTSLVAVSTLSSSRDVLPPERWSWRPSAQQPQPPEKTVEQTRKNIQVLKGLPESQLIPVMNLFATSLGVKCNFCHVVNAGQLDPALDDKPEKKQAREMITMTLGINKTSFNDRLEVSCYTCHAGHSKPVSVPQLPLAEVAPRPEGAGTAAAAGAGARPKEVPPTADQILDKYAAALGNAATFEKLTSRTLKGTLHTANGADIPYEVYQVEPSKIYAVANTPRQGLIERGFDGSVGWEKNARGLRELGGEQLAYLLRYPGPVRGAKLKAMYTRVGFGGKEKIDGHDVYVLRATTADNKRERLFFDAQTGLLLRRTISVSTVIGIIPEQVDYDDYREVDGVKMPFTIKISSVDQNYSATLKFTEIKVNVPVDESKFHKPAPLPPAAQPKP